MFNKILLAGACIFLASCSSVYYSGMEKLGIEKREILVDRIEDTKDEQIDTKEQFSDALEAFRSVVNVKPTELASVYDKLKSEFEDSEDAANDIRDHIDSVKKVAEDLFDEWEDEIERYDNVSFKRQSQRKLSQAKVTYKDYIQAMDRAESKLAPALKVMEDHVLFLKHNLNAQAITNINSELSDIELNVENLLQAIEQSINEADRFIQHI